MRGFRHSGKQIANGCFEIKTNVLRNPIRPFTVNVTKCNIAASPLELAKRGKTCHWCHARKKCSPSVRGKTKRGKTRNKDKVPREKVASKPNDHDWFWFGSRTKNKRKTKTNKNTNKPKENR